MEKHKKTYEIRSYECNQYKELRLLSLFNIFQDGADEHADMIGVGYDFCIKNRMGWVGAGYHIKVNRFPRWEEKIELTTWPSASTALTAIRDFNVVDEKGEEIIHASSQWVLLDMDRMRPLIIQKSLPFFDLLEERKVETSFPKIGMPERIDFTKDFPIFMDDIDVNKHVNNAVYPLWASEGVPPDFIQGKHVAEMEIAFKKSAVYGDVIRVLTQMEGDQSIHAVVSANDPNLIYAQARITWKSV